MGSATLKQTLPFKRWFLMIQIPTNYYGCVPIYCLLCNWIQNCTSQFHILAIFVLPPIVPNKKPPPNISVLQYLILHAFTRFGIVCDLFIFLYPAWAWKVCIILFLYFAIILVKWHFVYIFSVSFLHWSFVLIIDHTSPFMTANSKNIRQKLRHRMYITYYFYANISTVYSLYLTLCLLCNFSCFFVVCLLFSKSPFSKNSFRSTIRVSNSLESDQTRRFVRPDLSLNCLQRLLADDTWR